MPVLSRRELLGAAGAALASAALSRPAPAADAEAPPYVTCFYQFSKAALEALGGESGLPNGARYVHVFSHSHPGMRAHPEAAQQVRALGSSFKYALAWDANKYKGWMTAPDDQLKAWATEFREKALDAGGPADYFAFNEMPTTGAATPRLREQAARLLRHLHQAGGGPKLRGVFYFTERNLNPANWQGDADDFWAALDETCDLVVGEHYHSYDFDLNKTPAGLAAHLFPLPKWLRESGKPAQMRIAERKYLVLHSSYYGPNVTGWAGVNSGKYEPADLEKYFEHLVAATRHSEHGRTRIGFGPLATKELDPRMLPVLARVLRKDATSR